MVNSVEFPQVFGTSFVAGSVAAMTVGALRLVPRACAFGDAVFTSASDAGFAVCAAVGEVPKVLTVMTLDDLVLGLDWFDSVRAPADGESRREGSGEV